MKKRLLKLIYIVNFRYPFLAHEIFNCEINSIFEKFFEAPEVIKQTESNDNTHASSHDDAEEEEAKSFDDEEKHDKENAATSGISNA